MFGRKKEEEMEDGSDATTEATPSALPLRASARASAERSATSHVVVTRPEIPRRAPDIHGAPGSESKRLVIGREISLQGEINACEKLVVEGNVEANVNDCREIEVGETGTFKGEAEIESAEISGLFEGTLTVRDVLTVRATGRVRGKVTYGQLEVDRGGRIDGEISALGSAKPRPGEHKGPVAFQTPAE